MSNSVSGGSILSSLEVDPRKWLQRLTGLGRGPTGPVTPPTLPASMPSPTPAPAETPVSGPLKAPSDSPPLTTPTLSVPNRNDPRYTSLEPHGLRRVGLSLVSNLGGPFSSLAEKPLNAADTAYARDVASVKENATLADTQSQIAERNAAAQRDIAEANRPDKQPATKEPLHVAPGEMVQKSDGTWEQVGTPKQPERAVPEEEKAISDHLAAKGLPDTPANRDQARKDLKVEDRPPQEPTADDKAVSDHLAAQGLGNTPANRDKARTDLVTGKAVAAAQGKDAETKGQLRESSQQALKNMNALYKLDTPAANNAFMLSYVGATYEGIRGARLNKGELDRAIATRTLPDQLQKAYDLYVEKKILTPRQKKDMLQAITAISRTYDEPAPGASGGGPVPSGGGKVLVEGKDF